MTNNSIMNDKKRIIVQVIAAVAILILIATAIGAIYAVKIAPN